MELVGYARVSTREERQVFDRQVDALKAAGCERVFEDRGSGASADRPGLKECLGYLRRGDVLVVLDLDRLGRLAGELEAKGVGFRALNASFDTTTPMGRAFLQIQAAFAEMERNVIRQRVKEGIAAARARPQGRQAAPDDARAAALRPAPHGRPGAQRPLDLPRAGRRSHEHAVSLPARRRHAQSAGGEAAWGGSSRRSPAGRQGNARSAGWQQSSLTAS